MKFVVEVKRREGESFESLLRRFSRKIQQSGILVRARKNQFYEESKSKNLQRQSALRRQELAEERELQKRLGKPVGNKFSRRGRA